MATRELKVSIVGDSKSLEKALGRAGHASEGLGRSFSRLGKTVAVAGAALGVAAAVGIKKSIDAASNLTEQVNKANIVFKGSEKQVLEWSKGLERSFGLSQRAALEAAGTFGNMLVPMGFARKEAASMSEQMVELAGDMASFNNASPEDTLLAIRSGLAGEAEPLRKYGVFLSEARVQQEALTETGKKNVKQLTVQEKAVARYNLILKDTKDTQGDFARSAGTSLANQMRILRASWEDVTASIGKVFLPVAIRVLDFVNTSLIPGISGLAGSIADVWEKIGKAPDIRTKLRVTFEGVTKIASGFVDALISKIESLLPQKPLILQPQTKVAVGGGGVDWDVVAADMIAGLSAALAASADLAKALATTITKAIRGVDWPARGKELGPGLAVMLVSAFVTILDPAFWAQNWDLTLAIALVVFRVKIVALAGKLAALVAGFFGRALAGISPTVAAAFGSLIDDAGRLMLSVWARVGPFLMRRVASLFEKLGTIATFVIKVLGIQVALNAVAQFARGVGKKLTNAAQTVYDAAYTLGSKIISGIMDGIASLGQSLWNALPWYIRWAIQKTANNLGSTAEQYTAQELGKPLAAGVIAGFVLGIRDMPPIVRPEIKAAVIAVQGVMGEAAKVIGVAQARAIVRGFLEEQPSAKQQITQALQAAVREALQKAQQAVRDARAAFASAFGELASQAMSAFDAAVQAWKPPAQKAIDAAEAQRQAQALTDAINAATSDIAKANAAMAEALAGGDPEKIQAARDQQIAAQKAYDDAVYAQWVYSQQQLAAKQQEAHDKRVVQQRAALDRDLKELQAHLNAKATALTKQLAAGEITEKEFNARMAAANRAFREQVRKEINEHGKGLGVDAQFWGSAVGMGFSQGLTKSINAVIAAVLKLVRVLEKRLRLNSNAEEGPLADLDRWWSGLAPTLVKGIDFGVIGMAGVNIAKSLGAGVARGAASIDWMGLLYPAGLPTGLGQSILDSIAGVKPGDADPAVQAITSVSDTLTTAGESVTGFQNKIEALPGAASAAFTRLVELIQKALLPLPKLLAPMALAFLAIADSILALGDASYQARAALRDTAADIARLLQEIAAAGAAYGQGIPELQHGGPVRRGRPYVVGEAGPELFVPSTSGRIIPGASSGGGMPLAGTTVNVAVYGDVTGDEVVRKVREGLLRIDLLNPGSPIVRPA